MERPNFSTVSLHHIPPWTDLKVFPSPFSTTPSARHGDRERTGREEEDLFDDPLLSQTLLSSSSPSSSSSSKFPLDPQLNSKIHVFYGDPWCLSIDAIVNSSNETLDIKGCNPRLHAAAGPMLSEECASLGGCRVGMAQITGAYDLPARKVIHTVGPNYVEKYHSAAENALSRCYESCLELLIEHDLHSIAFGCNYMEGKGYPREKAAHVALRTVRQFLERQGGKINDVVLCLSSDIDIDIYERLLLLYFPRNKIEERYASFNLPPETGKENGENDISERKIRIKALPGVSTEVSDRSSSVSKDGEHQLMKISGHAYLELSSMDSSFLVMTEDPDRRREEQWAKASKVHPGWSWTKWLSHSNEYGGLDTIFHHRYLARAKAANLSWIGEMKILYRGGIDKDGCSVMVVVGAHFLRRSLGLEQFLLYVVKEFEPIINKPYTVVYFHSAAALQFMPDTQWMKHIHQLMGPKHKANLHKIYMVHPTMGLKANVLLLRILVDSQVWAKVVYVHKLNDLFTYVAKDQLTIPDFVFEHDIDVHSNPS